MPEKVDHRRAIAERNAAGILDAFERLAERGAPVSMAAVAAEAGVSRPTLYAHYKTLGDVVEAAAGRVVRQLMDAFAAARLDEGPASEALDRMLEASWGHLATYQGVARFALEHLGGAAMRRSHQAIMTPLGELIERGRRDGSFRKDLPAEWLQTLYVQLVHGAEGHAAAHGVPRDAALELLRTSARDLFLARGAGDR